jgi:hypothetical protein
MSNLGFDINIENIQFGNALMYIQYINLVDKSFRVNNVFLNEQEQFRVFCRFQKRTSQFPQEGLVYIKVLLSPSTIRLWNNLPTDLRNSPCQQMFKNEIRKIYDIPEKLNT